MQDTKNEIFNGTLSGILNEMREQQSGTATRQDLIKKIQKQNKVKNLEEKQSSTEINCHNKSKTELLY